MAIKQASFVLTDHALAQMLGDGGIMAGGFAWVYPANALSNGPLAPLFGGTSFPLLPDLLKIYSAYGKTEAEEIPGVGDLHPVRLDASAFGAIKVERDIFRPDERACALLIFPGQKNEVVSVTVKVNDNQRAIETVRLNKHGVGLLFLSKLEMGTYRLEMSGTPDIFGTFTVAEFSVPKLSASLKRAPFINSSMDTIAIAGTVLTYGEAFAQQALYVRLSEAGTPIGSQAKVLTDTNGNFTVELDLERARDQLALQIESIAQPDFVCQVALVGSSQRDRELTQVNDLGQVRSVSLIPRDPDQDDIRGLYFEDGMRTNTPIDVANNYGRTILLTARVETPVLLVTVYDPVADTYTEHELRGLMPGTDHEIEITSPFALVMLTAWVREGDSYKAWLGHTKFVRDSNLQLRLAHEDECEPNGSLGLQIYTSKPATVAVFAYPAALTESNSGTSSLARAIKETMGRWGDQLPPTGHPTTTLFTAGNLRFGIHTGAFEMFTERGNRPVVLSSPGGEERSMRSFDVGAFGAALIPKGAQPKALGVPDDAALVLSDEGVATETQVQIMTPLRTQGPLTICAMLVQVESGRADITIPVPGDITRYHLSAFAIGESMDWASTESQFEATQPVFVDMRQIRFLMHGDVALGRAQVQTRSGKAIVNAFQDGVALPIQCSGQLVQPGSVIDTPATVEFIIDGPGTIVMDVECAISGETDSQRMVVQEPRSQRSRYQQSMILMPGQTIRLEDLPEAISMMVLPGLQGELAAVLTRVGDFAHQCCEQTSASLLSLLANICQGDTASETKFNAGYDRMYSMLVGSGKIAFYPGHDSHPKYSTLAARNLARMRAFQSHPAVSGNSSLNQKVSRLTRYALQACEYYRVMFDTMSPQDASEAWDMSRPAVAASYVRDRVRWNGTTYQLSGPSRYAGGTVGVRAEAAYGAAVLARANMVEDAVHMANWVRSQLGETGFGHSTYDGIAVTFMMMELNKLGLGSGEAEIIMDGITMSLAEALAAGEAGEITAKSSAVMVGYMVEHERNWTDFEASIPVQVGLLDRRGQVSTTVRAGDDATLVVRLPQGYQAGLLATICLPPSLALIEGGAQVVQATRDFAHIDELKFAVKVLTPTLRPQGVAVLVTNMYDDKQAGNPAPFKVTAI